VLRILYVTDSLMAGGIESQLLELVTRLDRSRFEPQIVCLYGPTTRDVHFQSDLARASIPLHFLDLSLSVSNKLRAVERISAIARRIRPHLIQTENYHSNHLSRISRPLLPPTQLVGTVRGVLTSKQLRYERLSYRACSHLVASAEFLKHMLVKGAGVPDRLIDVVPNAVDVERFATAQNARLREQIAPAASRMFVSMGRISRQKSMHLIPEAIGLLKQQHRLPPDFRTFIVGPDEHPDMVALLEAKIQQYDLSQIVIRLPATRIPEDYYHACDVSILFSRLEGIPLVALESLAAGRPVIISEEANAAEVIEHGKTGWVVQTGDIAHLAETLFTALTVPDVDLARMQQVCVRRAAEYSIHSLVGRYSQLYDQWCAPQNTRQLL
jgi:glycosyltransferase involved in cell wall biosynthesis